jgi:hypothetical protein
MISWWLGSLIFVAILVTTIVIIAKSSKYGYYDDTMASICFWGIIGYVFLSMVCFFATVGGSTRENSKIEYRNKQYVYSITDNFVTHGEYNSFFTVGNGFINQDLYYFLKMGSMEEGFITQKFNSNEVRLFPETDLKEPYYVEKYELYDLVMKKNFFFGGIFKPLAKKNQSCLIKKELHIPAGYLQQEYKLDSK